MAQHIKITNIKAAGVDVNSGAMRQLLVKISTTDNNLTGITGGYFFKERLQEIKGLMPFLIGKNPFEIEKITRALSSRTSDAFSISCIETGLWDIIAKAAGKPIYQLFEGPGEKVKAYLSTGGYRPPEERARDVRKWRKEGYKAVKLRTHQPEPERDVEVVKAVRDEVGEDMDIMADANEAWSEAQALYAAKEFEKLGLVFLEEPLKRDDLEGYKRLAAEVGIAIAGGEALMGLEAFEEYLAREIYDIIQPDLFRAGGFLETRKIFNMARAKGKVCILHNYTGGLGLAAALQLAGSVENMPYIEFPVEWNRPVELRDIALKEPIRIDKEGFVSIPERPGIGVELKDEILSELDKDVDMIYPNSHGRVRR